MAKKGVKHTKYTPELKMEVAKAYLSGNGGYKTIQKQYNLKSFRQVVVWVKIYKEIGPEGFLVDKRGRNSKGRVKSIKLDEMTLEQQIEYLKMEVDILKKVKALQKN